MKLMSKIKETLRKFGIHTWENAEEISSQLAMYDQTITVLRNEKREIKTIQSALTGCSSEIVCGIKRQFNGNLTDRLSKIDAEMETIRTDRRELKDLDRILNPPPKTRKIKK
jgi:hypothetical protein